MSIASQTNVLHNGDFWKGKTYLNTAAEGLPLQSAATAVGEYLNHKSTGEPGRVQLWQRYEQARELAAQLFQTVSRQTALVSSTTEALNTIANAIDWQSGDEVVLTSVEFPSNMFPWVALQQKGVVARIVRPRDGRIWTEDLLEQINPRTRLVTVSQVSYATGQQIDPLPLWERVRNTPTLLCVDATQAAGRVPVNGKTADFTIASCFKWLNSIHGSAIMTCSERALAPEFGHQLNGPAGWLSAKDCFASDRLERFHARDDAQKFQAGMPNFDSVYSLAAALQFHTADAVAQRHQALKPLVKKLVEGFREWGLEVLLPSEEHDQAGIVPMRVVNSDKVKHDLAQQNIFVQGDDGRIRAAIHWYNTEEDIQNYLDAISKHRDQHPAAYRLQHTVN